MISSSLDATEVNNCFFLFVCLCFKKQRRMCCKYPMLPALCITQGEQHPPISSGIEDVKVIHSRMTSNDPILKHLPASWSDYCPKLPQRSYECQLIAGILKSKTANHLEPTNCCSLQYRSGIQWSANQDSGFLLLTSLWKIFFSLCNMKQFHQRTLRVSA